MPDRVILDQRWAVEGIYTVLGGETHAWSGLQAGKGIFTLRDLQNWGWRKKGYGENAQLTFLDMMLACGVCFELVPAWMAPFGEAEYVAPAALPLREEKAGEEEAKRQGLADLSTRTFPDVSMEGVRAVLVKLGKEWGQTALLWRDGAQVEAFYKSEEERAGRGKSLVTVQWEGDANNFFGDLKMIGYGDDLNFFGQVTALCEEALLRTEAEERNQNYEPEPEPVKVDAKARLSDRYPIRIGISFAGGPPEDPREQWPMALRSSLQSAGFQVEDYRQEQDRPDDEKAPNALSYLDKLVRQDFLVIFVSRKYLFSPWCLYEAMRIFESFDRAGDPLENKVGSRIRVFAFPECHVSLGKGSGQLKGELDVAWREQSQEYDVRHFDSSPEMKGSEIFADWYEFARNPQKRERLATALLESWKFQRLDEPVDLDFVGTEVRALQDRFQDWTNLSEMAIAAWKNGEKEQAKGMFLRMMWTRYPDTWEDRRGEEFPDKDLNEIGRDAWKLV